MGLEDFNIFDYLIQGAIWLVDAIVIPIFMVISEAMGGFNTIDWSLIDYAELAMALVYPIIGVLNIVPITLAVLLALQISMARKLVAVYMFVLDLIPVAR